MRRATATALVLATVLGGCGSTDPIQQFRDGVDNGASCSELFAYRNQLDPKDPVIADYVNPTLQQIGCHSSSSERTP